MTYYLKFIISLSCHNLLTEHTINLGINMELKCIPKIYKFCKWDSFCRGGIIYLILQGHTIILRWILIVLNDWNLIILVSFFLFLFLFYIYSNKKALLDNGLTVQVSLYTLSKLIDYLKKVRQSFQDFFSFSVLRVYLVIFLEIQSEILAVCHETNNDMGVPKSQHCSNV